MKKILILILLSILSGFMFWSYLTKDEVKEIPKSIETKIAIESNVIINPTQKVKKADNTLPTNKSNLAENYEEGSNLEDVYRNSNDLYSLALTLHERAQLDDPDSQYFLFRVLFECGLSTLPAEQVYLEHIDFYQKNGVSTSNPHLEYLQRGMEVCSGFDQDNYKSFIDKHEIEWLYRSAVNGNPKARAWLGAEVINQLKYKDSMFSLLQGSDISLEEATKMLEEGLNSEVGEAFYHYASTLRDDNSTKAAYRIFSCEKGFNCELNNRHEWRWTALTICLWGDFDDSCFERADMEYYALFNLTESEKRKAYIKLNELREKYNGN